MLFREFEPFRFGLLAGTVAVLGASVLLAAAGASLVICLPVLVLAPAVTVVGYAMLGHRPRTDVLQPL